MEYYAEHYGWVVRLAMHIKSCICVKNIDLRQNVLFATKEAGVKIKYDECLVQG
jgi:hypothetical protein